MAFEDTLARIRELKENFDFTEEGLIQARDARDRLTDDITNARRRLERKKTSNTFPNRAAGSILKSLKKEKIMSAILIEKIDEAIESQTNTEFDLGEYKSALYKVANKQDIYKMITSGDGWSSTLSPLVSFEEEAGNLNDWATGIEAYRDQLGVVVGEEGSGLGAKATIWWLNHVYSTKMENVTVRGRLSLSGKTAPFWSILQNGSQPLASDRPDESFNPLDPVTPTDFIGEAEESIKLVFSQAFDKEKEIWFNEIRLLEQDIDEAVEVRNSFTEELRQLTPDIRLSRKIIDSLGKKAQYVDQRKLVNAIREYRAGEEYEKGDYIELTRSGAGARNRVRLSHKKFEGYIEDL